MNASTERSRESNGTMGTTAGKVQQQVAAMSSELFEVGLYKPDAGAGESIMITRVWDAGTVVQSVPWLRLQNPEGRNIYSRPKGEHNLSMVDDLTQDTVSAMKQAGFNPAVFLRQLDPSEQVGYQAHQQSRTKPRRKASFEGAIE